MELGHLLTHPSLTCLEVSLVVSQEFTISLFVVTSLDFLWLHIVTTSSLYLLSLPNRYVLKFYYSCLCQPPDARIFHCVPNHHIAPPFMLSTIPVTITSIIYLLVWLFMDCKDPENGGRKLLQWVGNCLQIDTS